MTKPFTDCSFRGEYGPYANAAYGRDGTLYVAFIASSVFPDRERDAIPRHFFLARSTDDGWTFVTTRAYEAPDQNRDLGLNKGPMLAVDPTNSNKVYVGWRQGVRGAQAKENLKTSVAATSDGGRTFAAPVNIADGRGGDYPGLAVDGDGTLHAVVCTRTGTFPLLAADAPVPVKEIIYVRSTDSGRTFTEPVDIDPGNQSTFRPPDPGGRSQVVEPLRDVAQPRRGQQHRDRVPGRSQRLLPGIGGRGQDVGDRRVVNDDKGNANQFEPGISVPRTGGSTRPGSTSATARRAPP